VIFGLASQVVYAQGGNQNPGVIPANAEYLGKTYGEWGASWWKAAFAIPIVDGDHPLFSGGAFQGENGMVFLAAVVGQPVTIDVTIPPGTPLFLPIVNTECSQIEDPPFFGETEEELRQCANDFLNLTSNRFAEIDFEPVQNIEAQRSESPLFEFGPLPENNVFGEPEGTTSDSVDAGYYLLLVPLSVGTHVVRVGGTFDLFGVSIDTTFVITVEP
jgi:hypothetical protein